MTRYSFGGDEHVFAEISEEMSLDAFFRSLSITRAIAASRIAGVTEICPANASFQIRFDPDRIRPNELLAEIRAVEGSSDAATTIEARLIEIPVLYDDPWTREVLMRFRERHQDRGSTDLAYAARINGYSGTEALVAAHAGSPWIVSMVGFVAGLPFLYQMVERAQQIEVPKYLRPRTDTPRLTVGHGGCFGCIYSVRGAGGYQMLGITPMPIYDPRQEISYLREFMILFRPGDIVRFRPVGRPEYDDIVAKVEAGRFEPAIRSVSFSLAEFQRDPAAYNRALLGSAP